MSLIKRTNAPALFSDKWLSDFFDSDRFFDSDWMKKLPSVPAVNVKENENNFEIDVAAPGLTKKDFNIEVENGVLTISSEKKLENESKEKNFTRQEFSYSSFSRSFVLPENINEEDIKAQYEDGLLKLKVAKKAANTVKVKKAIEIK